MGKVRLKQGRNGSIFLFFMTNDQGPRSIQKDKAEILPIKLSIAIEAIDF